MQKDLRIQIRDFLTRLESAQLGLLDLFVEKRRALVAGRCQQLIELQQRETEVTRQLQGLLGLRNRILADVKLSGIQATSLEQLAQWGAARSQGAEGEEWQEILAQIQVSQERVEQLRHESWVHWIISHRCYNHYTEVLDLIAQGGVPSPTYGNAVGSGTSGGTLLDASI